MAALAGFNTTSIAETIPGTQVNGLIIPAANMMRVYEAFSWIAFPTQGATYRFPQMDVVAVTGTQTEADELTPTSFTTSGEEFTMATIGVRAIETDQPGVQGSVMPTSQKLFVMGEEVRNRVNRDVLAALTGATNVSDNTGFNLDLDNFNAALALFRAQHPTNPRTCFIGSTNQIRDLIKAIQDNGNGGLIMGAGLDLHEGVMRQGYKGNWSGVEIYEGETTQADASNDTGGFVSAAPLGLVVDGQIQPFSGLGLAVWRKVSVESIRAPGRIATDHVVHSMYRAGITADSNVRAFISKKAA